MARRGNSVFGIDLGKHVFKGVLLQRKGDDRFVLTSYASREVPDDLTTPEELASNSSSCSRISAEAPKVRDRRFRSRIAPAHRRAAEYADRSFAQALRLNGLMVLNQECKTCARLRVLSPRRRTAPGHGAVNGSGGPWAPLLLQTETPAKYPRGRMLRPTVKQISEACSKSRVSADILRWRRSVSFNAFEFAYPETFAKEAFPASRHGPLAEHGDDRQPKGTRPRPKHRLWRKSADSRN